MSDCPFLVLMDTDDDGEFDKSFEDLTDYLDGSEVIWSRGKNQNKRFAPAQAGIFDGAVKNHTRRFSPWNLDSDLAGMLGPGHLMQVRTKPSPGGGLQFADGTGFAFADGTGFQFSGVAGKVVGTFISEGFPQSARWEGARARIPGIGVLNRLVDTEISTTVHQLISTSAAIHLVLDKIEWPEDKRDIDEGLAIIKWFAPQGEDGFRLIEKIVATEGPGATWGEDEDGNFVFRNRDSLTTNPRSTMVQKELSDLNWHIQDLSFEQNYRDVIKAARVTVDEKEPGPLQEIWTHGGDLVLGPNEERRIYVSGNGLFINGQTPTDVASNTIWKFEGDQALLEGNFKGEYLGQITAGTLPYNATASDFQDEFEPLSTIGVGNIEFSGGPLNVAPVYAELKGAFAGLNITTTPTIIQSTLNPAPVPGSITPSKLYPGTETFYERQQLIPAGEAVNGEFIPVGELIAGEYTIGVTTSLVSGVTANLPYDATREEIQEAIRDISPSFLGSTTCDGGPQNTHTVTINFRDVFETIANVEITSIGLLMEKPSATVKVEVSQPGGEPDFVKTAGTLIEISLEETSGAVIPLNIKAGDDGLTLSKLRLRAQPIETVRSQEYTYPPDTMLPPSKIHRPDVFTDISLADAKLIAQGWVAFYGTHRPSGTARNETSTDDAEGMDEIFSLREQDMIKLINYQSGLSHKAHIRKFDFVYDPREMLLITDVGWELAE